MSTRKHDSEPQQARDELQEQQRLSFEQTLSILARVPKAEVEEMEANRPKKRKRKDKSPQHS
jgi:hypothetical protein